MEYSIKLLDTNQEIAKQMLKAVTDKTQKILYAAKPNIENAVRIVFGESIKKSPTVQALIHDDEFRGAMGVVDPEEDIEYLVKYLNANVLVGITHGELGLKVFLLRPGYSEIADDPKFIITDKTREALPWLKWLLERGDDIIIQNYFVKYDEFNPGVSRTGLAIMIKGQGKFFRIPPEYAGTEENNFITQEGDFLLEEHTIDYIVKTEIQSAAKTI